ncbi:MAG: branched-chain amino acid ABC transporter permease [Candidimonas sp.]
MFLQQLINGLVVGSIYSLFALGFTLGFGVLNILNLAHGAVFMASAFVGLYVVSHLELPLAVAFLAAVLAGGVLSVLVDFFAFRPLRKRGADEFGALVSSMGASLVLISLAQQLSDAKILSFPFGTFPVVFYQIGGVRFSLLHVTVIFCMAVMVGLLFFYMYRTKFGRQVRAVAVSESTSVLLGIRPGVIYFQTFFIAGALAGVAGVIIGVAFNSVHFLMGEPMMLRAFLVVILGGMGSIAGAVVAGLIIGVLQVMTATYVSTELSDTVLFALLFIILLVRPTGFFRGLRREARVTRQ